MQIIVIVGPTGVGKTKLSVELAKKLNGEIINGDSTQIYKGMNIATAKITEEEKENIPHHLFDIKDIKEDYSVYHYQKDCREKIKEIISRGHQPIIVGGTGLYLKAALYDYQFQKETMKKEYEGFTNEELYQMLKEKTQNTDIHPNNRKRMIRALNRVEEGKAEPKKACDVPLYDVLWIGLTMDREKLYERINHRVEKMIQSGLLEEAKEIYDSHIRSKAVLTPIGYKELFPYFENEISLEEAISKMKQNSRHYAKRQYTWFRNQVPVKWFDVDFDNFNQVVFDVETYVKEKNQ